MKIPKRIAATVINSLKGGVVPRIGLPYITVGREAEITALLNDVDIISEGGAAFRFIVGKYGSGKSFLLQTIRNYVMDKNFVVVDADLSPERRLQGTKGQGIATYKELIRNNLENLKQEIEIIRSIDYTRFSKKNKFVLRNKDFSNWLMTDFSQFVSEGAYLAIAVNTDQIGNMIATGSQGNVTATSPYTSVVITKLIRRTADIPDEISRGFSPIAVFLKPDIKNADATARNPIVTIIMLAPPSLMFTKDTMLLSSPAITKSEG